MTRNTILDELHAVRRKNLAKYNGDTAAFLRDAQVLKLRIYNHVVVTARSLGRKPKELKGTSAVAAKRRQQVPAVGLAVAASRLTVPHSCCPWADAQGYVLPSLRDYERGQFPPLIGASGDCARHSDQGPRQAQPCRDR